VLDPVKDTFEHQGWAATPGGLINGDPMAHMRHGPSNDSGEMIYLDLYNIPGHLATYGVDTIEYNPETGVYKADCAGAKGCLDGYLSIKTESFKTTTMPDEWTAAGVTKEATFPRFSKLSGAANTFLDVNGVPIVTIFGDTGRNAAATICVKDGEDALNGVFAVLEHAIAHRKTLGST